MHREDFVDVVISGDTRRSDNAGMDGPEIAATGFLIVPFICFLGMVKGLWSIDQKRPTGQIVTIYKEL